MRRSTAAVLICALALLTSKNGNADVTPPDPADVQLMALNMYHEAKGEGRRGMLAVGWVVLNRLGDAAFPKTIEGIVYQNCQWRWTCDERNDAPRRERAWREALTLAKQLLTKPPSDPTRGALWLHADTVADPGWRPQLAPSTRIGNHLFYARPDRLPRPRRKPHRPVLYASR